MALGKRYEMYLPLTYNPNAEGNRLRIEEERFDQTYKERFLQEEIFILSWIVERIES